MIAWREASRPRDWHGVGRVVVTCAALAAMQATAHVAVAQTRPPARPAQPAPAAPNIVVLLVNDWGWQDLSVPLYRDTTAANRRYATPAIAALAAQGVTFTDAYGSAPVGAPTRVALLTGRSAAMSRVTDDSLSPERNPSRTFPAIRPPAWNYRGLGLNPGVPNTFAAPMLPKLLHDAGYRTVHVGRTGWGIDDAASNGSAVGFDRSIATVRRADSVTAAALRALDAARTARKPFFLLVVYDALRRPPGQDDRFVGDARQRGLDERDATYASQLTGVDTSVSDLMTYLRSNALDGNTVVILLSDNGADASAARGGIRGAQNAPLKSGMGSAYEGGLRIPLIVRWPGVARPGFRSLTPVVVDDIFPTLLRAANVKNAAQYTRGIMGRDLVGTLDNSLPVPYDRPLLWHYPHYSGQSAAGAEPFSAVRSGKWKLIYFYSGSRYELYDLSNDIGESRDLSLRQPAVASRLSALMREALSATQAQLPIDSAYNRPFSLPGRILVPTAPPAASGGTAPPAP